MTTVVPGMLKNGNYAENSAPQKSQLQQLMPFVQDSSQYCTISNSVCVADYGSSDGANSISWMKECIKSIKVRNPSAEISTVFIDVPRNDWNYLLSGPAASLESFVFAVGRSFYQQVLPSNTLSLGVASTSFHWLTESPSEVGDHILGQFSSDKKIQELWSRNAREAWRALMELRSKELMKGGRMLVTGLAWKDDGKGFRKVFGTLNTSLQLLVDKKKLHPSQKKRIAIPMYIRSAEESTQGLEDVPLKLVHSQIYEEDSPLFLSYSQHGNLDLFAEQFAKFIRAAYEPIIRHLISIEDKCCSVDETMNALWEEYASQVKQFPQEVSRCNFSILVFEKQ